MFVYRIYYHNEIVYVGRTSNMERRMGEHFRGGKIDIDRVSKIEFAETETEADMNLYELYYILKLKPVLNDKDTAKDQLTIQLPELKFKQFFSMMWDQWREEVKLRKEKEYERRQRIQVLTELAGERKSMVGKSLIREQYAILTEKEKI